MQLKSSLNCFTKIPYKYLKLHRNEITTVVEYRERTDWTITVGHCYKTILKRADVYNTMGLQIAHFSLSSLINIKAGQVFRFLLIIFL